MKELGSTVEENITVHTFIKIGIGLGSTTPVIPAGGGVFRV
jgi:hypothetical protein